MDTDSAAAPAAQAASPGQPGDRMLESEDLAARITELQNVLLGTESIESFTGALAVQAGSLVADSLSCAIALRRAGQVAIAACTDELASRANELQDRLAEGPGLTALEGRCLVEVEDLGAETRWPRFTASAAAAGLRSCLALPLVARDEVVGALSLYSRDRRAFGAAQTRRAQAFAQTAAGALALGLRLASYAALTDQLQASLSSRAVIDRAVGVIMARQRCAQDTAFQVLRAASQSRNVKLRDLAGEVVTSVAGEIPQPPPFERG